MNPGEKACTECGKEKLLSEFHKRCDSGDGHRSRCRKCIRGENRRHRRWLKSAVFAAYGGAICADPECDEGRFDVLTLDHIGGGGNKHRREIGVGRGWGFYRWLRNQGYPPGYQVLCFNHNSGRNANGKEPVTAQGRYLRKLRTDALKVYGGAVCAQSDCDVADLVCLTIDHIGGGGSGHRRQEGVGYGVHFYQWLRRNSYPPGFQVLCFNHNHLKYIHEGR